MSNPIPVYMNSGLTLVNQTNIDFCRNNYVIAHGKIQSIKNNTLHLLTDPINNFELLINGFRKNISVGEYVAIIGKVASDKTLDFIDLIQLDKDFDLEYANEIIPLCFHSSTKQFFVRI